MVCRLEDRHSERKALGKFHTKVLLISVGLNHLFRAYWRRCIWLGWFRFEAIKIYRFYCFWKYKMGLMEPRKINCLRAKKPKEGNSQWVSSCCSNISPNGFLFAATLIWGHLSGNFDEYIFFGLTISVCTITLCRLGARLIAKLLLVIALVRCDNRMCYISRLKNHWKCVELYANKYSLDGYVFQDSGKFSGRVARELMRWYVARFRETVSMTCFVENFTLSSREI